MWKWGWPQLRPQHMIQFPQSHSSPPISFFSSIIYNNKRLVDLFYQSYFFGPSSLRSLALFVRELVQPIAQAARRIVKNFLVKCCLGYCLIFQVIVKVVFIYLLPLLTFNVFTIYIVKLLKVSSSCISWNKKE